MAQNENLFALNHQKIMEEFLYSICIICYNIKAQLLLSQRGPWRVCRLKSLFLSTCTPKALMSQDPLGLLSFFNLGEPFDRLLSVILITQSDLRNQIIYKECLKHIFSFIDKILIEIKDVFHDVCMKL